MQKKFRDTWRKVIHVKYVYGKIGRAMLRGGVENFSITELLSGDGETAFYIIEQSANDDNF